MLVRALVVVSLLVSGLWVPPAAAASTPAQAVSAPALAGMSSSAVMASKPRATLTASYVTLPSGKMRVTVSSNAKKVKLNYRTAKNKKRTTTITIRKGQGAKTLAKGSQKIVAQAKATSKLRAGVKTAVRPFVPPPVTPPVVTPPVAPPPSSPPPITPPVAPPPAADTTAPGQVTGLAVTATTTSSISLSWTNPTDADLAAVIVRRATGTTAPTSPTDGAAVALATPTATAVTDTGLDPDTAYAYAVFTRDTTGNTSAPVGAAGHTSDQPGPTVVDGSVDVKIGASATVDLADLTDLTDVQVVSTPAGVGWAPAGGSLAVSAAMGTPVGSSQATLTGVGCLSGGCGQQLELRIQVTVLSLEAPEGTPVDEFTSPSPDRLEAAVDAGFGAQQLTDEALITVGSPGSPGGPRAAASAAAAVGAVVSGGMQDIGVYEVRWPAAPTDLQAALATLNGLPGVAASPSTFGGWSNAAAITPTRLPPGDWDDDGPEGRWHLDMIHAPVAWDTTTGDTQLRVGIVEDDRVRASHEDLSVAWVGGGGAIDNHATHVAGLACAEQNGRGVVGAAWGCPLVSSSYSTKAGTKQILAAVRTAIEHGARIINMSTGANQTEDLDHDGTVEDWEQTCLPENQAQAYHDAVQADKAAWRALMDGPARDVLFTIAAANACAPEVGSPWGANSDLPNVITVAATNSNQHLASFSNFGSGVELAAPGGVYIPTGVCGLWSTIATADDAYYANCGTSQAAPIVAGIANLVWAAYPEFTAAQVGQCIMASATTRVTGRDDTIPQKSRNPVFPYTEPIPLVDAQAAVTCGTEPPDSRGGSDWIARDPATGRSVLVANGRVNLIGSGELFNCLAKTRVVWDIPTLTALGKPADGVQLSCYDAGAEWSYTPTAQGGNTGTNIILRNEARNAWLINTAGEIQTIPDGGTYLCLAQTNPVIWNTPDSAINGWEPVGSAPAGCGDGTYVAGPLTKVTSGTGHACAIVSGGAVKCWGYNASGQLGDGTTTNSPRPVMVQGITGASAISAGRYRTCAILVGGSVQCWGDGSTSGPLAVPGIANATAISAGTYHVCVIVGDGTIECQGGNQYGQLGDGSTTSRFTPVEVVGITDARAIGAGGGHTCAIVGVGGVKCWGHNDRGQLGDGTNTDRSTPVSVSGISDAIAVAAGDFQTCIVRRDGEVLCWGRFDWAQGGDSIREAVSATPVAVPGIGHAAAISAGGDHTCAILIDRTVQCWGQNGSGQLGDSTATIPATRSHVDGLTSAAAVSAGGDFTCAAIEGGRVDCWGSDYYGQLGDDMAASYRSSPAVVAGLAGVSAIATGSSHRCAIISGGGVRCWGSGTYGQLGDGLTTSRWMPVEVSGMSAATAIAASNTHTCAVESGGTVRCWGYEMTGNYSVTPKAVPGVSDTTSLATQGYETCAMALGGGVTCWGWTQRTIPGITDALQLVAGDSHMCAIIGGGEVRCWGNNSSGQLGDGTTTSSSEPVSVSGISGATSIVAATSHTCVIVGGGGVRCWGANESGQLGDGTTTNRLTPVSATGITDASALASSGSHVCAVVSAREVKCWGANESGQLGDGTTTNRSTPVSARGITDATTISASPHHTCAIEGNVVKCWGANESGQLGDGTTTNRSTPGRAVGIADAIGVVAGTADTCATSVDGALRCWGLNRSGLLGVNPGWSPTEVRDIP